MEDDVVGRLRYSVTRLARLLRQQDASGLTPTVVATLATIANEGPLSLGELAAREQVAPPTITKVVTRLECAGLIERRSDRDDGRVRTVSITPAGRRQLETIRRRRNAWLLQRLDSLGPADRAHLDAAVALLERLIEVPA